MGSLPAAGPVAAVIAVCALAAALSACAAPAPLPGTRMVVDWDGLVSRQDIVLGEPQPDTVHGLLLGNGDIGVSVFGPPEALTLQVGKSDIWDYRDPLDNMPRADTQAQLLAMFLDPKSPKSIFEPLTTGQWYKLNHALCEAYVSVTSTVGGVCALYAPWKGAVRVREAFSLEPVAAPSRHGVLRFETTRGTTYVVDRPTDPLESLPTIAVGSGAPRTPGGLRMASDAFARCLLAIAAGVLVLAFSSAPGSAAPDDPPRVDTSGLPPRTVLTPAPERPVPDWLRTNVRIAHLPPTNPYQVRQFLEAGYNVITANALRKWDVVGPSASLYKAEEVKAADAYMRWFVNAVHKGGARAVLYVGPMQTAAFSPEFAKAHPDWLRTNADGKPDAQPNMGNIRTPFADWVLKQLAYVTREYKVDGFWFDGFAPVHLHTYDEGTRKAFREVSDGADIPKSFDPVSDPVSRLYLDWHQRHFLDYADRMRAAIRAENPNAIFFVNHSGPRTWYFPSMYMGEYPLAYSGCVDVSSVELYWDVPGDALYQQFVYAFMQSVTHERGASVWIQPSAHGISGVSSPVEIQLRGLEGLPWGVYPEYVESTGREEYLRLHGANIKARDPWLVKSEPVPYVGIVASEQTRTLYRGAALPVYLSHTLGAFRAIFEKHWPVRILTELDLEDANLEGVRVLVLPNVACMSDRAVEVVRRFVRNGGGLVATFETSLYSPTDYQRRADFALADLFRAKYAGSHVVQQRTENLQLTLDAKHPIVDDPLILAKQNTAWRTPDGPPPAKGPLALIASATEVTTTDGASVVATYNLPEPGKEAARYPAIVVSEFGRGRVVYLPASVDKGMFFYPDTYMRQILANACAWAARGARPPLEVQGPLVLATTFRAQPAQKRHVVHLLNAASSWGMHSIYQKLAPLPEELAKEWGFPNQSELRGTWPVREEVIALHDIRVTCRIPGIRRAFLQPENRTLELRKTADGVEVVVPRLEMHSMVVFE